MDRRAFISTLAGGLLAAPLAAEAQPQPPPWRIGVLWEVREVPPRFVPLVDWLREDLRTLGFNDRDLHFEVRQVEGASGLQDAARELIRAQPRVIWTSTDIVARIVRAESSDVPIVFGVAADPVQGGVVESWAKPGGNVTGVAVHGHVPGKRLEILKEMVPGLRRVLVMPDPTMEATTAWLAELREAARRLGLSLVEQPVASKADIERWPEIIKNERVDGIVHIVNATVNRYLEDTTKALGAARVPDISYYLPAAENRWAMAAYAVPHREAWRMSARLVARILRGAKPQDLPVESADVFELHINLGIAKERGVRIPHTMLQRANKIFE
jgi:putative ABC transport system substrate-binding protein